MLGNVITRLASTYTQPLLRRRGSLASGRPAIRDTPRLATMRNVPAH